MYSWKEAKVKVVQLCLTLYDPMDYSLWNSPGQNTGVGSLSLLQGFFPTQGSSPGLPHCRQILYQLSHKGSPRILEWVAIPSPEDIPNPGIKLGSPALQVDSLPLAPPGKPMKTYLNFTYNQVKWKWKSLSCVRLFATPWTIQSTEFSRPEYWSG